jgi:hypothetical protein
MPAASQPTLHGEDAAPDVLDVLVERVVGPELGLQRDELIGALGEGDEEQRPSSVPRTG